MNESETNHRAKLFREAVVFQLKLLVDGLRDLVLVPISLVSAAVGLLRGGEQASREFDAVLRLGQRSEQWINLFGSHQPVNETSPAGSIDTLVDRVEKVVRDQAREGGVSDTASRAIRNALDTALEKTRVEEARRGEGGR